MSYFITVQQKGKFYYYRSLGIRWVTNPRLAESFDLSQLNGAIENILTHHPDYQLTIVPVES